MRPQRYRGTFIALRAARQAHQISRDVLFPSLYRARAREDPPASAQTGQELRLQTKLERERQEDAVALLWIRCILIVLVGAVGLVLLLRLEGAFR